MTFIAASRLVFQDKRYLAGFLLLAILTFGFLIYLPINSTNNRYVSGSISTQDLILFGTLSILTSISVIFNIFLMVRSKSLGSGFGLATQGGASLISSLFASLFATATCAACATFLFGILGVSGVFFLLDYRIPITLGAILILLISLYFTSQKILGVCKVCRA